MRVLVSGGAGFIGKAVVKLLLEQGHEPIVLDRATGGDITKPPFPAADHVIHLAGVLGTDELFDTPELAVDINIKGAINILRWCAENNAGYTDITMPPVFPSVYTSTKLCTTHLAKAWHHTYGVRVSQVRAFNAFGPGQKHGPGHPRKIIPAFSTESWEGTPMIIWGDGTQTVDLVHTDDVARMLVSAMDFGDCQVFDAGTGVAFTVNEVAEMVGNVTGNYAVVHRPMRRGEVPTFIKAEGEGWELLDWKPEFRPSDLIDTVLWYKP